MTLRLSILACVVCCARPASAEQFPYTAYVTARDVYIRSGPGEKYYPVARLDRGCEVEVYRHDPGGWYAIRPPAECFSWVSAEFIEPHQGNTGVVTGDRVVARVGSSFSDMRDVIQVRLDRGEEVEILEAHEFNSVPAAQTWYKIAPPAGEFRWISSRYLDRGHADVDRDDSEVRRANFEEAAPRSAKNSRPRPETDDADDEQDDASEANERRPPRRPERRRSQIDLKEEAEDLDLTLSAIVVDEPAHWDFSALKSQAEEALSRAETALERGRIRRVLRKIDNFVEIRQRHLAVMSADGSSGRAHERDVQGDRHRLGARSQAALMRYDGVGRLTQISSVDPRLPQFALIDSAGQVAAYVSPAPGVNLRRYLNQDVGINGTLGYLPERQANHLTAKRIVPVSNPALR
jgi:hypothetical protein